MCDGRVDGVFGDIAFNAEIVILARFLGQASALVEPVAAVVGAAAVVSMTAILPYALSFAAGAMIYVVVEELIPESHQAGNVDLATVSFVMGFALMMVLDVALG